MFKKKFYLSFLFCYLGLISSHADEAQNYEPLESRIERLKEHKEANRIKEEEEETRGQAASIADWKGYAKDIEAVRKLEIENRELQKQINELEKQKPHP